MYSSMKWNLLDTMIALEAKKTFLEAESEMH